jgi:hypothetical protein
VQPKAKSSYCSGATTASTRSAHVICTACYARLECRILQGMQKSSSAQSPADYEHWQHSAASPHVSPMCSATRYIPTCVAHVLSHQIHPHLCRPCAQPPGTSPLASPMCSATRYIPTCVAHMLSHQVHPYLRRPCAQPPGTASCAAAAGTGWRPRAARCLAAGPLAASSRCSNARDALQQQRIAARAAVEIKECVQDMRLGSCVP